MCDKPRLRSAWAYTQSEQSFYELLEYYITAKQNVQFLSFNGGYTGWAESTLIKMPAMRLVCGFNQTHSFILFYMYVSRDGCHETAHMQIYNIPF